MKKLFLIFIMAAATAAANAKGYVDSAAPSPQLAAQLRAAALDVASRTRSDTDKLQALQLIAQARLIEQLHCLRQWSECDPAPAKAGASKE